MTHLLDTNTCIVYLNGRSLAVRNRLDAMSDGDLAVCSVVRGELSFGAAKSIDPAKTSEKQLAFLNRFPSFPFDDSAAAIYGPIRAHLERGGQQIGANDLFIAAIALANNLILVTHNTSEFARVPDLTNEDWQTDA